MSDYTNSNVSRSEGVSAKGLLIAVLVLVALIFGLSLIGGGADGPEGAETAPAAAIDAAPAAPAVTE